MTTPEPSASSAAPTYSPAPAPANGSAPGQGRKNPLGLVAFILGVATVGIGILLSLTQAGLVGSGNFELIGAFSALQGGAVGLLGIGTTIVGVIALVLPRTSKPLAAAGTALGASSVLSTLSGLLYGVIVGISSSSL